jgi:hypothetical protein
MMSIEAARARAVIGLPVLAKFVALAFLLADKLEQAHQFLVELVVVPVVDK